MSALISEKSSKEKLKPVDMRVILEDSILNLYGFFDNNVKKARGSKLLHYNEIRAQSPTSAKMIAIDQKYGGKPKINQMVRDGHYPKFSEMID